MKRWMVVMVSLLLLGFSYQAEGVTWTVEEVTNNSEDDKYSFITTSPMGVHIVYNHYDGDGEVFYATNATGAWQTHRVTDNTRQDYGYDIVAKDGNIYIAIGWDDTPDGEISYCKGKPGAWDIKRVTDDSDEDDGPTMAIDKDGFAHMTYWKNTGGDNEIFYANNITGSWVEEQVTDNVEADVYSSLALDGSGNPHITFVRSGAPPAIFYIKKEVGVWKEEKAADILGAMTFPVLVLDSRDFAHLAYAKFDGADHEIYYTNNVLGSWQESKVTSNDFDDLFPTLALDPQDKAHIAYLTAEAADIEVFYANNTAGIWDIGRVTDNSVHDVAQYGRYLVLDNYGFGHITFQNDEGGDNEIYHAKSNEPLFTGIEERNMISSDALMRIHPNPFSSLTAINYEVSISDNVSLKVYDVTGKLVRTLIRAQSQEPGVYTVVWNGRDDTGKRVPSGVYFYRLTTGGFSIIQKGILK